MPHHSVHSYDQDCAVATTAAVQTFSPGLQVVQRHPNTVRLLPPHTSHVHDFLQLMCSTSAPTPPWYIMRGIQEHTYMG